MKLHLAGFIPLTDAHSFYQLISLDKLFLKIAISLFLGLPLTCKSKSNQHRQDHNGSSESPAWKKVQIFYFSVLFFYGKKKLVFFSRGVLGYSISLFNHCEEVHMPVSQPEMLRTSEQYML